jgi:hypothetical protein
MFSVDGDGEIMDACFHFLVIVFKKTDKIHLYFIMVKNQVISLFGGEANFNDYLAGSIAKFILATKNDKKYDTCCHSEALLNKHYHNVNTPGYATI